MDTSTDIAPVTLTIPVRTTPERAFAVFTGRMRDWWPESHHIGGTPPAAIVLEPRTGGRWFERGPDGTECEWGTVLAWEPPHRLLLAWQLDGRWEYDPDLDRASEVEVTFTATEDGTRVDFTHRRLERHGDAGPAIRDAVAAEGGWPTILTRFADATTTTA
ncbi:MAG TPA: SRPBCC family protein [Pseudonocardiaceae bacterium]